MAQSYVLFIANSLSQADELSKLNAVAKPNHVQFRYPPAISTEKASPDSLLKDCQKNLLEDEDEILDAVIALNPANDLVNAALIQNSDRKLNGPSFESILMVVHEYYNKMLILDGVSIAFDSFVINDDAKPEQLVDKIEDLGGCVILKAAFQGVAADSVVRSEDVEEMWPTLQEVHKEYTKGQQTLISDMMDTEKYPMVTEPVCILQPDWTLWRMEGITHHMVEGCVVEGEFVPWCIVDLHYAPINGRQVLKYARLPSQLSETVQHDVWGKVGFVAEGMKNYGFNDHFFHMHVMCTDQENGIKIINLSTGIHAEATRMYLHVLNLGNNFKTFMDIKLGRLAVRPNVLPMRLAIRADLWCFKTECVATDVYDFKAAKQHSTIETVALPELELTDPKGTLLARIYLSGKNEKECHKQLLPALEAVCQPGVTYNWVFVKGQRESLIPSADSALEGQSRLEQSRKY